MSGASETRVRGVGVLSVGARSGAGLWVLAVVTLGGLTGCASSPRERHLSSRAVIAPTATIEPVTPASRVSSAADER